MNLGDAFTANPLVLIGILMMAAAWMLRRRSHQASRRSSETLGEMQADFRRLEQSWEHTISRFEVRLLDLSRDVEARLQTRIAVLEQLLAEAEAECTRLERAVAHPQRGDHTPPTTTADRAA